jgi:RNA-directed DNA polymerase
MNLGKLQTQISAPAGKTGKAEPVGLEVGGVRSSEEESRCDLWTLSAEERARLKASSRDAACSQACQRSKGHGDGSQKEIRTPEKVRKLQRTLYCKAKAQPTYRFWSLYGELIREELLDYALQVVTRHGGAPGIDGQTIETINASQAGRQEWLKGLKGELQTKTYRASRVRRVYIPKKNGGQRPLGIPTVKDRVVQMAAMLVLGPIFEADFHPHSYGFRPKRNAHDAMDAILTALRKGKLEVVDADLSKYFDTIPHGWLMKLIAKRLSDASMLHLISQWLRAPVVEELENGRRRVLPNQQGVPQGGVISPLLANVYLNALDWAVNNPQQPGQPVMVRYADDLVILCHPGQGAHFHGRLGKWLQARGLKLNEEKTRLVHSRAGFDFLGFRVRWQMSRRSRRWYAHVEPSQKSQGQFRNKLREHLNHWNLHHSIREKVQELNRLLRGWSEYFHYRNSSRVFSKANWWVTQRMRRWLWRKHKRSHSLWESYPDELLYERYGLWCLPEGASERGNQ